MLPTMDANTGYQHTQVSAAYLSLYGNGAYDLSAIFHNGRCNYAKQYRGELCLCDHVVKCEPCLMCRLATRSYCLPYKTSQMLTRINLSKASSAERQLIELSCCNCKPASLVKPAVFVVHELPILSLPSSSFELLSIAFCLSEAINKLSLHKHDPDVSRGH